MDENISRKQGWDRRGNLVKKDVGIEDGCWMMKRQKPNGIPSVS